MPTSNPKWGVKLGAAINIDLTLDQTMSDAKVKLVFLDACRGNPFAAKIKSNASTRSVSVQTGLAEMKSGEGIPNAPAMVASAGITIGEKTGWFGTLRWRYLAASPLTEDNAFRSPPTSIFNGRVGYRFENGWRIQLDALNLLNTTANQITYAYGSLIKTDSLYSLC
jgi:outer membrane receptor protein involved in Fe transport